MSSRRAASETTADNNPAPTDQNSTDDYVLAIGQRVRGARARRGMTRKDLSRNSDISQRYLAQVETGHANISVNLLSRIARAMNLDIHELLPSSHSTYDPERARLHRLLERLPAEQLNEAHQLLASSFSSVPEQTHGVALVGLRGGGKTTLGRLLADRLSLPFIRLSNLIESLAGMDIPELFARGGQDVYRNVERQAVEHVLSTYDRVILETGGSLVSERETYNLVINSFYTVWVQASPKEHMSRVIEQGDLRPIRGNREAMDDLKLILEERRPQYEEAHYRLDTSGRPTDDCLKELSGVCQPYCNPSSAGN
jgi:XRE family aerobic/anaerobic benzoate catabolism transcriptional regulator